MPDRSAEPFRIKAYGNDPWVAVSLDRTPDFTNVLGRLATIQPAVSSAAWPVGLEIALQEKLFFGPPATAGCARLLGDFGVAYRPLESVRPLRHRPPSELAAYYLFRSCQSFSVASLCKANSLLGGSGVLRTHAHQTSKYASAHRSVFMPAGKVPTETQYLVERIESAGKTLDPIAFATAAMLHLLTIHPFADANGRLSCLLFQYCLFKRGIIAYPLMPLAPFLEKNRSEWLHALLSFHLRDTLTPIYTFLGLAVERTVLALEDFFGAGDVHLPDHRQVMA